MIFQQQELDGPTGKGNPMTMTPEETMSKIDDGGPAFPTDSEQQIGPNSYHVVGMSLRQWYAGMALQGILANNNLCVNAQADSNQAFLYADAMIAHEAKETKKETP